VYDGSVPGYDGYSSNSAYADSTPQAETDLCGHQVVENGILAYRGLAACMTTASSYRSTTVSPLLCSEDTDGCNL